MFKNLRLLFCGVSLPAIAGCNNTGSTTNEETAPGTGAASGSNASATSGGGARPTIAVIPRHDALLLEVGAGGRQQSGREYGRADLAVRIYEMAHNQCGSGTTPPSP